MTFESRRRFSVGAVSTYQISELARRTGVPASTLRFYEQAGLLAPLVAARIAEAERRIAEPAAFAARLSAVLEELGGPAPVDGCGRGCGCVAAQPTETPVPPGPALVEPAGPVSGATR